MFRPVEGSVRFPELERQIAQFWKDRRIYEKSLELRAAAPRFVFYEGPPTANGLPHPGHCLTRAIKDLFPRYRSMRGYRCDRKAGWDTHGLPVEVEVCKDLGIHSKEEIEAYGVEPFIHRCVESVFRYVREWERLTERIGFWIHLDEAYVTYHQSYIESVWWALKNLFDRGLLYQGYKIVWWWAQGGTALSSGEVGQGYREVADPSVYVRCPLIDDPSTDLLIWTTTPWTLPSNQFVAVHPELTYARVRAGDDERLLVVAEALVDAIAQKTHQELTVVDTRCGRELVGLRYRPPFDYYYAQLGEKRGQLVAGGSEPIAWRVVAADFVTIDSGTGLVHEAPAFGEVDFDVLLEEQRRFVAGEGPELICAVGPDGKFTAEVPDYEGRWVKDADRDLIRALKQRGLLVHQEQYVHDYPFCWRSEQDPLIQYPRRSWFIRTTAFKDEMLANNRRINWLPEHVRDGRFGNFLESNVDWALSRERYWGTPLPIWVCEATGYMEAVASYDELLAKPGVAGTEAWDAARRAKPELSEHLKVHKPYIDAVSYDSPRAPGARMRRVSEVIDCWFDSGAMPFAQWGYPQQGRASFEEQFPADFISEAIDQTRGWFYSQLAISTMLFGADAPATESPQPAAAAKRDVAAQSDTSTQSDTGTQSDTSTQSAARVQSGAPPRAAAATLSADVATGSAPPRAADTPQHAYPHPFRNCIVLGLMLGEDGGKMSKSKRNYREPGEIFDRYGADALRWYFFANQPPWTSIRYSEQAIKESVPEFLLRLWNVYSFLVIYANIDGFDPAAQLTGEVGQLSSEVLSAAESYRPLDERGELDRWITSELNRTAAAVTAAMDAYDNYGACARITQFVDALSNWYVRRSRDRFWSAEAAAEKSDAYWTLYECLLTLSKLVAPFVPFLAETLWQNLVVEIFGRRAVESVHLTDYPTGDAAAVDERLSARMDVVREIVSLGRAARMGAKLKVRQPLSKVEIVLAEPQFRDWLEAHAALIRDELNVKEVEYPARADQYIDYTVLPDLKRLGPRLGKQLPALRQALAAADHAALLAGLERDGKVSLALPGGDVELDRDDLQVRLQAKPGWAAAHGNSGVVVLATEIDDALRIEGLARELVHAIQNARKELDCQYTDRIAVGLVTSSEELSAAARQHAAYIQGETLAIELASGPLVDARSSELNLAGHSLELYVRIVPH